MTNPRLPVACADDERRDDVAASTELTGIDWLEIDPVDQRVIHVAFLHPLPGEPGAVPPLPAPPLDRTNVVITGGERVTGIEVVAVATSGVELTVTVDQTGDFSPYVLAIVRSAVDPRPPDGFDPALSAIEFSFKANCPAIGDCRLPSPAAARPRRDRRPVIPNYLVKDYDGFRRLMLDHLANAVPGRVEQNPADPLVTAVEALAHVADRLSYRQDAVATEAYLGTARSRISVRRHARLLDYPVHDGCTARTWIHVAVDAATQVVTDGLPAGTLVVSGAPEASISPEVAEELLDAGAIAFATLAELRPDPAHNEISVHTWGGRQCCLPAGATRATLRNEPPLSLVAGDLLLFEQVADPVTGRAVDADPARRQVVRLVDVTADHDPLDHVDLLEVTWGLPDALTDPITVTAVVDELGAPITCAVARGNIVLAHHARPRSGTLPSAPSEPGGRFRPILTTEPLACAEDALPSGPAAGTLLQDPARCLPLVTLSRDGERWETRADLLASDRFDRGFVVEVERDGRAALRFGDDVAGRRPAPSTVFDAAWWTGGGAVGNAGRDVLNAVVTDRFGIVAVANPLPAEGGTDPEAAEHVRQHAPAAFITQERAVTTADWVEIAERRAEVAHAAARLRWTGSWWTVFLTLDLAGGRRLAEEPELAASLRAGLDRFRIAGYDLELRDPVDVAVELRMHVCAADGHFASRIRDGLVDVLSARTLADGRRGLFHPDNFTFGDPLTVSRILAAAAGVPGVASASVTELHRVGAVPTTELSAGLLIVGDLEIIRLDNDPSRPERGVLHLDLDGGL